MAWGAYQQFANLLCDLRIGGIHLAFPEGIDVDTHWLSHPNGIRNLDQHLGGNPGRHHVFSDMSGREAADRSTLEGSFPEKAPPPWGALPP